MSGSMFRAQASGFSCIPSLCHVFLRALRREVCGEFCLGAGRFRLVRFHVPQRFVCSLESSHGLVFAELNVLPLVGDPDGERAPGDPCRCGRTCLRGEVFLAGSFGCRWHTRGHDSSSSFYRSRAESPRPLPEVQQPPWPPPAVPAGSRSRRKMFHRRRLFQLARMLSRERAPRMAKSQ